MALLSLLAMTNSAFMMVETHPRMRKQPKQPKEPLAIAGAANGTPTGKKGPDSIFAKAAQLPNGGCSACLCPASIALGFKALTKV